MASEEMNLIEQACGDAQHKVAAMTGSLPTDLKQAVARALDAAPLVAADLERDQWTSASSVEPPATLRRLGRYVAGAAAAAGRAHAERLQAELQGDLAAALNRLYLFATTVDRLRLHVERRLATGSVSASAADVTLVDRLRQSWTAYRQGQEKGADQDTQTALAVGGLVVALGLPAIEQALATLAPEDLTSGTAVEQFKREYWRAAGVVIENHLASGEAAAAHMLEVLVANAFDRLKRELDRGLDQVMPVFDLLPAMTDPPLPTGSPQRSLEFTGAAAAITPAAAQAGVSGSAAEPVALGLRCPQCGALAKAGAKFCGHCGASLERKRDNGDAGLAAAEAARPVSAPEVKTPPPSRLVVIEGPRAGQSLSLHEDWLEIGRKQLDIEDTTMSRRHVIIRRRGRDVYLQDVSTNGTWINNGRISGERLLMAGDQIRLGKSVLRFEV